MESIQRSHKKIRVSSCTEAAALAGFNSPQYFCRVFRKHTGMTPAEYKNLKNDDCEVSQLSCDIQEE